MPKNNSGGGSRGKHKTVRKAAQLHFNLKFDAESFWSKVAGLLIVTGLHMQWASTSLTHLDIGITRGLAQSPAIILPPDYVDCSTIDTVEIVQELGAGKQKIVFEFILPNGQHVAAKRCKYARCELERLVAHEEFFYRQLYEQQLQQQSPDATSSSTAEPARALQYYGFCSFPLPTQTAKLKRNYVVEPKLFSTGSTLFIELGQPTISNWNENSLENMEEARPKSPQDLEALRDIARQYDAFAGGPLKLTGDNSFAHQYMRNSLGQLRHIDFDLVEQMPPPVTSTLEHNCQVLLGGFAQLLPTDPRLNCSVGYHPEDDNNDATTAALGPPPQVMIGDKLE